RRPLVPRLLAALARPCHRSVCVLARARLVASRVTPAPLSRGGEYRTRSPRGENAFWIPVSAALRPLLGATWAGASTRLSRSAMSAMRTRTPGVASSTSATARRVGVVARARGTPPVGSVGQAHDEGVRQRDGDVGHVRDTGAGAEVDAAGEAAPDDRAVGGADGHRARFALGVGAAHRAE